MSYEENEYYEELEDVGILGQESDDVSEDDECSVGDERYMTIDDNGNITYKKMGLIKIGARKAKVKYEKARDFYNAVIEEIERELGSADEAHPKVTIRLESGLQVISTYVPEKTMYSTLLKKDVVCRPHVKMRARFDDKCKERINRYGGYRE